MNEELQLEYLIKPIEYAIECGVSVFFPSKPFTNLILQRKLSKKAMKYIKSGRVKLFNSIAVDMLTGRKDILLPFLCLNGIDIPLTYMNSQNESFLFQSREGKGDILKGVKEKLDEFIDFVYSEFERRYDEKYKPLCVVKNFTRHGGEGVSVFVPNKNLFYRKECMIQEFVYPPEDYMKDVRVLFIGGKLVGAYSRRVRERLFKHGKLRDYPPRREAYLTNIRQGGVEIKAENPEKYVEVAKKVYEKMRKYDETKSKYPALGMLAVDMISDRYGNPKVLEVDSCPNLQAFPNMIKHEEVLNALFNYLKEVSGRGKVGFLLENGIGIVDFRT
jgi:hypothetical protein